MNRSRNITMVYFEWEKGIGYDEKQDQKRRYFLDTPRPYLYRYGLGISCILNVFMLRYYNYILTYPPFPLAPISTYAALS